MLQITFKTKREWLDYFRSCGNKIIKQLKKGDKKNKTKELNTKLAKERDNQIKALESALSSPCDKGKILNEILMIQYTSYVVMLEFRNKIWPYEYMSFTRRIGEMWEPFCIIPFKYPAKQLKDIEPPDFNKLKQNWKKEAIQLIDASISNKENKNKLIKLYDIPWEILDGCDTQLGLDFHFSQNGNFYHCDFKSGFSSNEKGNTNRLLTVGGIYKLLGKKHHSLIFVRQEEDSNNHYLARLKNSGLWEVSCCNEAYESIKNFTGVDLRAWIDSNIDWNNDMCHELKIHLQTADLTKYLNW